MTKDVEGQPSANRSLILQIAGFVIVALTMIEMFTIPRNYFVAASFAPTISMVCVTILLVRRYGGLFRPSMKTVTVGIITAILLYGMFLLGNAGIHAYSPIGVGQSNETSIYGLFATTPTYLLVIIFFLDAVGFESYFRGNLQNLLGSRLKLGSVFAVALIDALIHLSAGNILFPVTTFVADSVWGLNYYYTRDLYSSFASHFLWDVSIFILLPII